MYKLAIICSIAHSILIPTVTTNENTPPSNGHNILTQYFDTIF